jgi:hypothetical protein
MPLVCRSSFATSRWRSRGLDIRRSQLIVGALAPLVKIKHHHLFLDDCIRTEVVSQCKKFIGKSGGFALRRNVKRVDLERFRCGAIAGMRCPPRAMLRTFV